MLTFFAFDDKGGENSSEDSRLCEIQKKSIEAEGTHK
jgi:hypothetical protein